jgi:hypothetical protein
MPLSRRYALFAATLKANVLLWAKARHRALRAGKCTMNLLPSHSNAEPLEEMLKLGQLLLESSHKNIPTAIRNSYVVVDK